MKIKKYKYIMILFSLLALAVSNGNPEEITATQDESQMTEENNEMENIKTQGEDSTEKEALFDQIKTENDKVRKLFMKSTIKIIEADNTQIQTMDADALYGDDLLIIKADLISETNDGYYYEIAFDENDNTKAYIIEKQAGEEETTVTEATVETFDIQPDYHRLIQAVMDLKDDLEVSEDGGTIKLSLKENAEDVLKYIENEYNLELTLVEEDEIEISMDIEFDKESKLLKSISLVLDPQIDELEDQEISVESTFTEHQFDSQ